MRRLQSAFRGGDRPARAQGAGVGRLLGPVPRRRRGAAAGRCGRTAGRIANAGVAAAGLQARPRLRRPVRVSAHRRLRAAVVASEPPRVRTEPKRPFGHHRLSRIHAPPVAQPRDAQPAHLVRRGFRLLPGNAGRGQERCRDGGARALPAAPASAEEARSTAGSGPRGALSSGLATARHQGHLHVGVGHRAFPPPRQAAERRTPRRGGRRLLGRHRPRHAVALGLARRDRHRAGGAAGDHAASLRALPQQPTAGFQVPPSRLRAGAAPLRVPGRGGQALGASGRGLAASSRARQSAVRTGVGAAAGPHRGIGGAVAGANGRAAGVDHRRGGRRRSAGERHRPRAPGGNTHGQLSAPRRKALRADVDASGGGVRAGACARPAARRRRARPRHLPPAHQPTAGRDAAPARRAHASAVVAAHTLLLGTRLSTRRRRARSAPALAQDRALAPRPALAPARVPST